MTTLSHAAALACFGMIDARTTPGARIAREVVTLAQCGRPHTHADVVRARKATIRCRACGEPTGPLDLDISTLLCHSCQTEAERENEEQDADDSLVALEDAAKSAELAYDRAAQAANDAYEAWKAARRRLAQAIHDNDV